MIEFDFNGFWEVHHPQISRMARRVGSQHDLLGEAWICWTEATKTLDPNRGVSQEGWALRRLHDRCRRWRAGERFGLELDAELADHTPGAGDPLVLLLQQEDEAEAAAAVAAVVKRLTSGGGTVADVIRGAAEGLSSKEIAARAGVSVRRVNQILSSLGDILRGQGAR